MATKLLILALVLSGCANGPCVRNSDCVAGDTCSGAGVCVVEAAPAPDGGGDGGGMVVDASVLDAATDGGP